MPYLTTKQLSPRKSLTPLICFGVAVLGILTLTASAIFRGSHNEPIMSALTLLPETGTQDLSAAPLPLPPAAPIKESPQKTAPVAASFVSNEPRAHLKIPIIGVNAGIVDMGLTGDGAMAVPGNTVDVGWFNLGTRPGETGSAVIGGHNRWSSQPGVFSRLNELKTGDTLSVIDAKGVETRFVVKGTQLFDATDPDSGIFTSESGTHLNLITCAGDWDPVTKSYAKRLVVFTDVVN